MSCFLGQFWSILAKIWGIEAAISQSAASRSISLVSNFSSEPLGEVGLLGISLSSEIRTPGIIREFLGLLDLDLGLVCSRFFTVNNEL